MCLPGMGQGKSFKESLKSLEADIQHANTLALDFPRDYDGACLQMRLSYNSVAHIFLFLVQWTNCSLAGSLGLLRIMIYTVYMDGTTTMSIYERKASLREFYAYIFPSLQQLGGFADIDHVKQRKQKYKSKAIEAKAHAPELDVEWEQECGICMEYNEKIVLPDCSHVLCIRCFRDWNARSKSCPFCRDSLKRVSSGDLWIILNNVDVQDTLSLERENRQRLFTYIENLPLIVSESVFAAYGAHLK